MKLLSGPGPGTAHPRASQLGYMSEVRVEFLLTAVVGLGALSIDMFLPSLPAISAAFAAPPATVQLTVTLFLMGFAVAQLVYGPLSDRYGRRGCWSAASASTPSPGSPARWRPEWAC